MLLDRRGQEGGAVMKGMVMISSMLRLALAGIGMVVKWVGLADMVDGGSHGLLQGCGCGLGRREMVELCRQI